MHRPVNRPRPWITQRATAYPLKECPPVWGIAISGQVSPVYTQEQHGM
jgi:hypothetical protein